jgi:hypothetical protein
MSGDWFQSRTRQAQFIGNVTATRGRVEFLNGGPADPAPDGPPRVLSGMSVRLDHLVYYDGQTHWAARDVKPGEEVELIQAHQAQFDEIKDAATESAGQRVDKFLNDGVKATPGQPLLLARTTDVGDYLTPTLSSIRWKNDEVFLFERFQGSGPAANAAQEGGDES